MREKGECEKRSNNKVTYKSKRRNEELLSNEVRGDGENRTQEEGCRVKRRSKEGNAMKENLKGSIS